MAEIKKSATIEEEPDFLTKTVYIEKKGSKKSRSHSKKIELESITEEESKESELSLETPEIQITKNDKK